MFGNLKKNIFNGQMISHFNFPIRSKPAHPTPNIKRLLPQAIKSLNHDHTKILLISVR